MAEQPSLLLSPARKIARPHQQKAMDLLKSSLATGHRRPLLQLPTGAGKTFIAAQVIRLALAKGKRVVFVMPSIALINQSVEAFRSEGLDEPGVIQAQHPMTDCSRNLQIASVQTLARRQRFETDLVIVDEAHRGSEVIRRWMAAKPRLLFIGLSATPWRIGMAAEYDDLIIGATLSELISDGILSEFRTFAPSHPDLARIKTKAGDYIAEDLSEVMQQPQLVADVVSTWLAQGEDRPTFCFCVDRAHAASLRTAFEQAGIPCGYVDATTDGIERELVRERFRKGKIKVVCNVGVLTTGIDWDVRCIILARPTKSELLYVQMVGRGLRTAEGKTDCLILDHSDNTERLGFVTDIHHDQLLDGKVKGSKRAKPSDRLPRPCSKCSFVKEPGCRECPNCGFAPERQTDVKTAEGELVQVGGKRNLPSKADRQAWFSQLLWIAEKPGWVRRTFQSKFGVPPTSLEQTTLEPTVEVINFVKSRLIAFRAERKSHAN